MSLLGKGFQVADTIDLTGIVHNLDGTTTRLFTAETEKADIETKTDKIEVYSGIGVNRTFLMHTKKQMSMNVTINMFDPNFMAYKNGKKLDTTSRKTIYNNQKNSVTTGTCIISGASRIISLIDSNENNLQLITTGTPTTGQVLVAYTTSNTGTAQVEKLTVTTAPTSAGNVTVTFNDGTTTTKTVALLSTDTVSTTAGKIATAFSTLTGWTVTSATGSADVLFTATAPAANKTVSITLTDTGSTGTGSLTGTHTTAGVAPSIAGATLTFDSGYTDPYVYATFEGTLLDATKDNLTMSITGKSFPKGIELIGETNVYDEEKTQIVGKFICHFYNAIGDPDGTYTFECGKACSIPVVFDMTVPRHLPDGTLNSSKAIGTYYMTEIDPLTVED